MESHMLEYLCRSLYVHDHPIYLEKTAYKENYCRALTYFVKNYHSDSAALALLDNFCHTLLWDHYDAALITTPLTEQEIAYSLEKVAFGAKASSSVKASTKTSAKTSAKPAYRLAFLLDCCFICAFDDESKARAILLDLKALFSDSYTQKRSEHLLAALYHGAKVKKPKRRDDLFKNITWCQEQKDFFTWPTKTLLVTAYHKGAGKATLINALTGKKLLHPALEHDYGSDHIHLLCSKAIEDRKIAIQGLAMQGPALQDHAIQSLCPATEQSITQSTFAAPAPENMPLAYYEFYDEDAVDHALDVIAEQVGDCRIGTKFHNLVPIKHRLCVIDTPTINAAQANANITKEALKTYAYDSLLYVLNIQQWGTDEECAYLQYLAQNVPQEKVVFALNKIDLCHGDNGAANAIAGTIEAIKAKLSQLGFANPQLYPLCAYFSMLNKLELTKVLTTDHEDREFYRYVELYEQAENDLSHYCHVPYNHLSCDLMTQMSVKCGLYALECRLLQAQ